MGMKLGVIYILTGQSCTISELAVPAGDPANSSMACST